MRIEEDTLGKVQVPDDAYYGAQTARAVANFPISGLLPFPTLVWGTLIIKRAAAVANMATGRLEQSRGNAILAAADEALAGGLADQFIVDPFQAGAGTSHNMNVNEVLANRATELLGGNRGSGQVNPNDHVNMGQSTNDVFPTSLRLAALGECGRLLTELSKLAKALALKGVEFDSIIKSGRTHLQDAVPITLGQEFSAYSRSLELCFSEIERALPGLYELGIGGTAVGTGLNIEPEAIDLIVLEIARLTRFPVQRSEHLIERMQNMAPFLSLSSSLKGLAVTLGRIANDFRLLASGPRTGFDEMRLPPVQPGSSIMPGKVNPSMAEMLNMVCFQTIGSDTTITLAVQAGQLELNVMMPVIAYNLLFSLQILTNGIREFTNRCVTGITANQDKCRRNFESSLGIVTLLAPKIGYHRAAEIAQEADRTGESIVEVIRRQHVVSDAELDTMLDPVLLTKPGVPGNAH